MEIKGKIKYRNPLIVTEDGVNDFESLLTNYFDIDSVQYSAELVDGDHIDFQTKQDLFAYDNSLKQRITGLTMRGSTLVNVRFVPNKIYTIRGETAEIEYRFNNTDDKMIFKEKSVHILNKMKAPYAILSFVPYILWICAIINPFFQLIYNINHDNSDANNTMSTANTILLIGVVFSVTILLIVGLHRIWSKIIPLAQFAFGYEKERLLRSRERRHNILYNVIIATVLAIVSSIIVNIII